MNKKLGLLSLLAFSLTACAFAGCGEKETKKETLKTESTTTVVRPNETEGEMGVFTSLKSISSVENGYTAKISDGSTAEGVLLSSGTGKASAYYSRMLDLNKSSKVVSFEMLADEAYRAESVCVSLVDAFDEDNFFSVKFAVHASNDQWTTVSVSTAKSGNSYYGYDNYNPHGGVNGYTMYANNFIGVENVNAVHQAFNFSYDMEENAVYMQINAFESAKLIDFDDRSAFNAENAFQGFATGQAYLKVTFDKLVKNGGFLATEIGGEKLSGDFDYKKANDLIKLSGTETNAELFDGAKGYSYPLPVPVTRDFLYGENAVSVQVKKIGDTNMVEVKDYAFVPETVGQYEVVYATKDNFGNAVERAYVFTVNETPNPIEVAFEEKTIEIGDTIQLPVVVASGGNGERIKKVEYLYNGEAIDGEKLLVDQLGTLLVKASVVDSIGNEKNAMNAYTVQAKSLLTVDGAFYQGAISGKTLTLPSFTAYDYKNGVELAKKVYVNDTEIDVEKMEYAVNGKDGDVLEIVYVGGEGTDEEVSKTFYVNVVEADGVNMAEYFLYDKTALSGSSDNRRTTFTALQKVETTTINYPFAVSASFLDVQIDFDENSRFEFVELSLKDYIDGTEVLLRIYYSNANFVFYWQDENGEFTNYLLATEYMETKTSFRFIYENDRKAILDYKYNVMTTLGYDSKGNTFDGFANYGVNVSFRLQNVNAGATFNLAKLSNQTLRSLDSRGDNVKPVITYMTPFVGGKASYGSTLTIPEAYGFDVLSQKPSTVYVSVYDPDFAELVTAKPLNEAIKVLLNEYGSYTLTFQTKDENGNRQTTEIAVEVIDEALPTIEVNEIKTASVGKKVTFKAPTVSDNLSAPSDIETWILIWLPEGKLALLKGGESYTFKKKGEYKVVYYAKDQAGNVGTREWVLTVK